MKKSISGNHSWKPYALSLATTLGVTYVLCAIFDALFPPYGLLQGLSQASPWPLYGSPAGFVTGFAMVTVAGFALGAIYGVAWDFWRQKLK